VRERERERERPGVASGRCEGRCGALPRGRGPPRSGASFHCCFVTAEPEARGRQRPWAAAGLRGGRHEKFYDSQAHRRAGVDGRKRLGANALAVRGWPTLEGGLSASWMNRRRV
jgi:hypothetical protein